MYGVDSLFPYPNDTNIIHLIPQAFPGFGLIYQQGFLLIHWYVLRACQKK